MTGIGRLLTLAVLATGVAQGACSQEVGVDVDGSTKMPALSIPPSSLMSEEGNRSRVEHILTERSLKGRSVAELNAALFGPRLERMKQAFPGVSIREDRIGGVRVLVYEPAGASLTAQNDRLLINVHGGGFVGCFTECGGLESIPVAALTGIPVVSIDYRLAPQAHYPAASQDVAAVYEILLSRTPADHIGLYGCSAGGLLTAQSLAWFQSHDLPLPGAAGIFCAGGDAAMGGDSRILGLVLGDGEVPPVAAGGSGPSLGYMAGASGEDGSAFPARDETILAHFPPTLIMTGARDFAMSSAVSLHSRLVAARVDARLHVWEGGRHAFFYDVRVPEAREALDVAARFFSERLK